ncbi:MAG: ATPase, T2SS/T4P/T4SS family [Candidatus ainarchaeum sp.]|nr:ATPase, T2SS/T4P/T4SS family [Candidatus ainarchaeum sp.]
MKKSKIKAVKGKDKKIQEKKDDVPKKVEKQKKENVKNIEKGTNYDEYEIDGGISHAKIKITKNPEDNVKSYILETKKLNPATAAFLEDIKSELLKKVSITSQEALDIKMAQQLKDKFEQLGRELTRKRMPQISEEDLNSIISHLINETLGLGELEFLLNDDLLEEICVNSSQDPVWVYHRKHGWIKSNIYIPTENQIWNYSGAIARRVGRQINVQNPLLDAYLPSGDRVNATLMPISSFGNTITIRKFARRPWTITDHIRAKTTNSEIAALLWLAIQYETNVIISGGTGSGKTSNLNVLSCFIPQNQRVVSIEQTREITLPSYLQWVPLTIRQPTNEGRGGVDMLDLMVNSLRMRPDRIVVGEIRRADEAQVLFEAMHTGHSVYATLHAETVGETLRRLTNPPINIPKVMLESLHLIVTMYRDRRTGRRRIFEIGEVIPTENEGVKSNIIYRWKPSLDKIVPEKKSIRLMNAIKMYTNMSDKELKNDLNNRKKVLDWMVKENINDVDRVGNIISQYYNDPSSVLKMVK